MKATALIFLLISSTLHAQQVSEICTKEKLRHDSAMYHEYGQLFNTCFILDSNLTGANSASGRFYNYTESVLPGDFDLKFQFYYRFRFPGAKEPGYNHSLPIDTSGHLVPDTLPFCGNDEIIGKETMEQISLKYLHQPLAKCYVYPWVMGERETKKWKSIKGHPYLRVYYSKVVGGTYFRLVTIKVYSIIVDAYTGKVMQQYRHKYHPRPGKF